MWLGRGVLSTCMGKGFREGQDESRALQARSVPPRWKRAADLPELPTRTPHLGLTRWDCLKSWLGIEDISAREVLSFTAGRNAWQGFLAASPS